MKIGRNDSCPCGSSKKYKKCCMEKDQALGREQARSSSFSEFDEEAEWEEESDDEDSYDEEGDLDDQNQDFDFENEESKFDDDEPEEDSADESPEQAHAFDALWDKFEAAEFEDKIALFLKTLKDTELMDDDMAFDMLDAIRGSLLQSGNRDRYSDLIETLREHAPKLYGESAHYYLQNLITNAVVAGRWQQARALANELAERAGKDIDIFNNVVEQLIYHGQLATLLEITGRAWPEINLSGDIVPWGIDEFADQAANFTVFDYLEHSTAPRADDPELQQRLAVFTKIELEPFTEFFKLMSGQETRSWTMPDFDFKTETHVTRNEKGKLRRQRISPGKRNFGDLSFEFLRYLRQHENISYPKAEMARENITAYLIKRYDGDLEERESMLEKALRGNRPKPKIKRRSPEHILCPDAATLEVYFVDLLHFLNSQYYAVAATYELLPAWLRFLELRQLIDAEQHQRSLQEIGKLQEGLLRLFEMHLNDPALFEAMQKWSGEAYKNVSPGHIARAQRAPGQ